MTPFNRVRSSDIAELLIAAESHNDIDKVRSLLARVPVNARNEHGMTALHFACSTNNEQIVKLLIASGAEVNTAHNIIGVTPLHDAAYGGHLNVVRLLLENNARIDAQTKGKWGDTPLHCAADRGHLEVVKLLLAGGAQINIKNKQGQTPLCWAATRGLRLGVNTQPQRAIVQELLQQGAYSYPNDQDDQILARYWEASNTVVESSLPFYTALLLAGVSTEGRELPEPLATIKANIDVTVANWLAPLEFDQALTSKVLRSFPRWLHWVEALQRAEQVRANEDDALKAAYADPADHLRGLKHFFLFPTSKTNIEWILANWLAPLELTQALTSKVLGLFSGWVHWGEVWQRAEQVRANEDNALKAAYERLKHVFLFSPSNDDTERLAMLERLKTVPVEILGLIRADLVICLIADPVSKLYELPVYVTQHLAAKAITNPTAYRDLHRDLFQHDFLQGPYKPPVIQEVSNATTDVTHAL